MKLRYFAVQQRAFGMFENMCDKNIGGLATDGRLRDWKFRCIPVARRNTVGASIP